MRLLLALFLSALMMLPAIAADRPNVILIMTDDQGYGDIAAHGNTIIKTPNLDQLHQESTRLTDYHVDPTCSPTRSALLTGRYSTRTGVWHTINGRSMMSGDEYTLAEYFKDNGYRTAMFGKWHLGDNAPLRPMDQGFEYAVWHQGGGADQGQAYFGNDYFDDTYMVNDQWQKFEGYCTDVWFSEAMKYIERKDDDRPFFIYMPTNAAHGPYLVEEKYWKPYAERGLRENVARFYGMIENIDENVGRLRAWLKEKGLDKNTILIFTTDNGSAAGEILDDENASTNAGMRGYKGSEYEGGHRVPFLVHWPAGGIDKGEDIGTLSAHIDVMPTLGEMCRLKPIEADKLRRGPIDGRSLASEILHQARLADPTGVRFVHSQRTSDPIKWRKCAVMTEQYRLVNGKELYDIVADPGQKNDIAAANPEVVKQLTAEYDKWWTSLEPVFSEHVRYDLGGAENPTTLMSHDWLMQGTDPSAWHQSHVEKNVLKNGPFMVNIVKAGKYRITPMRWPDYLDKPSGCTKAEVHVTFEGGGSGQQWSTEPDQAIGSVVLDLPAGPAELTTTLTREDGKTFGAYYVKIEWIE